MIIRFPVLAQVAAMTPLLSGCIHDIHPGVGGQCGVEAAHPSAHQGYAANACLIASWGYPPRPFCEAIS